MVSSWRGWEKKKSLNLESRNSSVVLTYNIDMHTKKGNLYSPQLMSQNCKLHILQTLLHIDTSVASCNSHNWHVPPDLLWHYAFEFYFKIFRSFHIRQEIVWLEKKRTHNQMSQTFNYATNVYDANSLLGDQTNLHGRGPKFESPTYKKKIKIKSATNLYLPSRD